jgi:hypothetical protein
MVTNIWLPIYGYQYMVTNIHSFYLDVYKSYGIGPAMTV